MAWAMERKCSKNLLAMSSYTGIVLREFERNFEQVERVHRHPARRVGLFQVPARGQAAGCGRRRRCCPARGTRPGRCCGPLSSLRLTHQVKFISSFWKHAFEELPVARVGRAALGLALDGVDAPRRPGMDGRVHVAERPFVGGELTVRVHVPFAGEQHELALGEFRVDQRQRQRVERQVPRREPRKFPRVGQAEHVVVEEVAPIVVASALASLPAGDGWPGSPSSQRSTT